MINKIILEFKKLDIFTIKIIKKGLLFCLALAIFSALLMYEYLNNPFSLLLFRFGLIFFKLSCYFCIEFIICGLVVDTIKKQDF